MKFKEIFERSLVGERKDISLFISKSGGDIIISDRNSKSGGDYKSLATINKIGYINYYVKSLPDNIKVEIEKIAKPLRGSKYNDNLINMIFQKDIITKVKYGEFKKFFNINNINSEMVYNDMLNSKLKGKYIEDIILNNNSLSKSFIKKYSA